MSKEELLSKIAHLERELAVRSADLEEARTNSERYRQLVEHAADGLIVHDAEGRFLQVNQHAADILGYTQEEMECLSLRVIEPDFDSFGIRKRLDSMNPGEVLTVEGRPKRKDGLPIVVEVRVGVLDAQAAPRQYIAFLRDISDRKETVRALRESSDRFRHLLEESQTHLVRVERLATLGTLAAGVGHELNNLAQVFSMAVELIAIDPGPKTRKLDVVGELRRGTENLVIHAKHLLAAGRPVSDADEVIDIGECVSATSSVLRSAGKLKTVRVNVKIPLGEVFVTMSRSRFEQVLVNLLINAAEALDGEGGTVHVSAEERESRVYIEVVDDGAGIAATKLARVFDAYFTTKAPERGTGLGLAVVRQIIEEYQGEVLMESELGSGTRIHFDLPRSVRAQPRK